MAVIMGGGPTHVVSKVKSGYTTVRTTKKDLDILVGGGEVGGNLFLGHEPDASSPSSRWIVQDVENPEPRGVFVGQLIEFFLKKDIFVVDISIDEAQHGAILGVLEGSANDL